jgi:hypothetical protein
MLRKIKKTKKYYSSNMELLRSSIIGKEFVNYRKTTMKDQRLRFSEKIRSSGLGNVPIVIDSVDEQLTEMLCEKHPRSSARYNTYGREIVMHMDNTIADVLKEVKIIMLQKDKEELVTQNKLTIGLEDGTIPELGTDLGTLYKTHRNSEDKILYLMISKEISMYGYVMSILMYLMNIFRNQK